jgi:hypothetical protein
MPLQTQKWGFDSRPIHLEDKGFASELAAAVKKVDNDELKYYILNGLDDEYNPLAPL